MYGSLHTTKHMTWHAAGNCTEDGKMGHTVDGKAWKEFDKKKIEFAKEHRNIRLGLAADGFNPFGNLSQSYGMWPSGQGYIACPTCNEETPSTHVNGKTMYVGHRRFLPLNHRWRNDKTFNGKNDKRPKPKILTGAQILQQLVDVPSRIPGKHPSYGGVKRQETATSKESTNPLMANSLPKTIMPTKLVKPQGFNLRPDMANPPFSIPQGQQTSEVFQALNSKLNRSLVNEPPLLLNFEDKLFAREPDIKKVH
ncbi:gag-pol polyprotein [Tanacetum coccineum]